MSSRFETIRQEKTAQDIAEGLPGFPVGILVHKYPQVFRDGEICIVKMCAEALAAGHDPEYPLHLYHGKEVRVISRTKGAGVVRQTFPDDEGLVDVLLPPFRFIPKKGAQPVHALSIIASVLELTGKLADEPSLDLQELE